MEGAAFSMGDTMRHQAPPMGLQPALPCNPGPSSKIMAVDTLAAMETRTMACLATWAPGVAATTRQLAQPLPLVECTCSSRATASRHHLQVRLLVKELYGVIDHGGPCPQPGRVLQACRAIET